MHEPQQQIAEDCKSNDQDSQLPCRLFFSEGLLVLMIVTRCGCDLPNCLEIEPTAVDFLKRKLSADVFLAGEPPAGDGTTPGEEVFFLVFAGGEAVEQLIWIGHWLGYELAELVWDHGNQTGQVLWEIVKHLSDSVFIFNFPLAG